MFAHIRKHQQWLFFVIIAVVVVSFVIFFTPTVQYDNLGGSGSSDIMGSIDGRPVSRKEYVNGYQEVLLRFLLATGQWPDQTDMARFGFDPEQETPSRLLLPSGFTTSFSLSSATGVFHPESKVHSDRESETSPAGMQ